MQLHLAPVLLSTLVLACGCARHPAVVQPKAAWRVVPTAGVTATLQSFDVGQPGATALRLTFAKAGPERRFVALEGKPQGDPSTAKALSVAYRLSLPEGASARLALLVLEKDGGAWFRMGSAPLAAGPASEARLPLGGFRRAEFAQDSDAEPRWDQAARFQVGIVADGAGEGMLELGRVAFTGETYRPTGPLPLAYGDPALWSVGKDTAADATLTLTKDGPGGAPAVRVEFAFPGGRHMFVLSTLRLQDVEVQGYRGLRFLYKAKLPAGIPGLLVSVSEQGDHSQYYAEQAPPPSEEWTTADIAFDRLKLGPWSKDENDRLDVSEIGGITIGLHGSASGDKGSGMILISGIELVP